MKPIETRYLGFRFRSRAEALKGPQPLAPEIEKCRLLAQSSGKRVLLLSGEPWLQGDRPLYDVMMFSHPEDARHMTSGWEFGEGRRNADEIWLVSDEFGAWTLNPIPHARDDGYPLSGDHAGNVLEALNAARGTRFEYGAAGGA